MEEECIMIGILRISMFYKKFYKVDGFEFESWVERFWCPKLNDFITLAMYRHFIKLPLKTHKQQLPNENWEVEIIMLGKFEKNRLTHYKINVILGHSSRSLQKFPTSYGRIIGRN